MHTQSNKEKSYYKTEQKPYIIIITIMSGFAVLG